MMKIIPEDIMKSIIIDYENGLYPNNLSKKYSDYSPYVIRNNLKYYGAYKSCHLTDDELEQLKQDFVNGFTIKQLVDKYKKSDKYIIEKLISDRPFKIIKNTFINLSNKFVAKTNDGYYVMISRDTIYKNQIPEYFHPSNPYVVKNIKNYLKRNNINSELLSETYINNSEKLKWKCGDCGKIFYRNWNNFIAGSTDCPDCSKRKSSLKRRISSDIIEQKIENNGYHLFDCSDKNNSAISLKKILVYDDEGYYYETTWMHMSAFRKLHKFHKGNPYTINNINHYLTVNRNGEYKCISKEYVNNTQKLKFIHKRCGCEFEATLIDMQGRTGSNKSWKYYKECPNCNSKKTESNHASILKQVFLHYYPDTELEEKSCINPETNRPLPTDIVNYNLKIAIEVQSAYHDNAHQAMIDKYKKEYWISKGYRFYDPDIRDYSILEMIQIFFPEIKSIPDYIDYNFSKCIDYTIIQKMLDDGITISKIADQLNIKSGTVRSFITSKKVFLPDDYKNKIFNIRPIVRLSKDNRYLEKFNSISDADKKGFKAGTVRRVLKKEQKFAYNSFWVYEDDYISGNYILPTDKFCTPVEKYDVCNNFIKSYTSIYEAEQDSYSNKNEIYRVASNKRKSSRNEKWKFIKAV